MATILIKRGQQADLNNLSLSDGELAIAYNTDKSKAEIYVGDGNGGKILLNPDTDTSAAVQDAKDYTDEKISGLVDGAPEAMLVLDGTAEVTPGVADKFYDALKCPKHYLLFDETTTAQTHTQMGGYGTAAEILFDKIETLL